MCIRDRIEAITPSAASMVAFPVRVSLPSAIVTLSRKSKEDAAIPVDATRTIPVPGLKMASLPLLQEVSSSALNQFALKSSQKTLPLIHDWLSALIVASGNVRLRRSAQSWHQTGLLGSSAREAIPHPRALFGFFMVALS